MKFTLKDGRVLTGQQMADLDNCGCVGMHDGIPHWIHMDELFHSMNLKMLEKQSFLTSIAFAREESDRLKELLYQMNKYGVVEIQRKE